MEAPTPLRGLHCPLNQQIVLAKLLQSALRIQLAQQSLDSLRATVMQEDQEEDLPRVFFPYLSWTKVDLPLFRQHIFQTLGHGEVSVGSEGDDDRAGSKQNGECQRRTPKTLGAREKQRE